MALANTDMIKGSQLMIFKKEGTASQTTATYWRSIGFATNHQLSIQLSTQQVSTKDHGDYPATLPQTMTWTLTAENVYSDAGELYYMDLLQNQTEVDLYFAKPNWNATNMGAQGYGIVEGSQAPGYAGANYWTRGSIVAHGKAYVTDFSINAPAGDYATLSVTFTGTGDFTTT